MTKLKPKPKAKPAAKKRPAPRPGAKRPAAARPKERPARARGQAKRDAAGLTPLERLFAVEYLVDLNATQAWHRASPASAIATCERNGHRALQQPAVQALVKAERDKRMEEAGLSVADVLAQLKRMMMYDPRRFFDEKGALVPVNKLDYDSVVALAGIDVVEMAGGMQIDDPDGGVKHVAMYTKKVKFLDRNSTLEKAMKYHGLFSQDNKQKADAVGALIEAVQAKETRLPIKTR